MGKGHLIWDGFDGLKGPSIVCAQTSLGFWGTSKSAASTPNLSQLANNTPDVGTYPPLGPGAPGTGAGAAAAVGSTSGSSGSVMGSVADPIGSGGGEGNSSNSFQQRRKRSESIGGLKSTAGTISRMVRKTSSNFLRKLAKNFEDKDAPPIPIVPQHTKNTNTLHLSTSSLSVNSTPSFAGTITTTLSDLPPVPKDNTGYGPFDVARQETPREATSDGEEKRTAALDIPGSRSTTNEQSALDQELSRSASTVESWLKRTQSDLDATSVAINGSASTPPVSSSSTAATSAFGSETSPPPNIRRPSHISVVSTEDGEEGSDTEQVPGAMVPIGSARLSLMYESGSIHLNQSQTSLYFSTKSALSDETENSGVKATAAALTRSSIRFSQYGLLAAKDLPLTPDTLSVPGAESGEKPLPARPVSMMVTSTSLTITEDEPTLGATPSLAGRRMSTSVLQIPEESHAASRSPSPSPSAEVTVKFTSLVLERPTPILPRETTDDPAYNTSKRCFDEDESFLKRDEISCYLGAAKPFNRRVVTHYMNHFDFSGKRLDDAFRQLCQKLMLKGETQEVDRVLEAFAQRYIDCNHQSILGSKDVVHAITYSILLLNTDLHVVQQSNSSKMSRSAFVKNTLQVVLAQTSQADRASEDSSANGLLLTRTETGELSVHGSTHGSGGKKRTPSVKSWRSGTSHQSKSSKMGVDPKANGGHGNGRWWMSELEILLKDIYTTVKHNQILLPSTTPLTPTSSTFPHSASGPHQGSARGGPGGGFLPRMSRQVQPSALIDAGFGGLGGDSGNGQSGANNGRENIIVGMVRRNSINTRTKQLRQDAMKRLNAQSSAGSRGLAPSSQSHQGAASQNGNADGVRVGNSRYSLLPPPSVSLGSSTHSTASSTTTRLDVPPVSRQQSQQSVKTVSRGVSPSGNSGTDHQPRFQMEGILHRKHLLERPDKKASHRAWRQLLVVLDQGGLSMFRADGQMGQAFEEQGILLDEIRLQHTITNILPPPGYSSARRHVFAIQLHSGAVFLFQTATALECEEWARTCNYWAAKTSKEPLSGGVVNMDYGWGRCLDLLEQDGESAWGESGHAGLTHGHSLTASSSTSSIVPNGNSSGTSLLMLSGEDDDASIKNGPKPAGSSFLNFPPPAVSGGGASLPSPTHSGFGYGGGGYGSGIGGGRTSSIKSSSSKHFGSQNVPLGDRVLLFDWSPPIPTLSMVQMTEEEQCENLKRQVISLESEMESHQEQRVPMMKLFLPKSHNYNKAFNNWERRSRYLLKEMVKYQIYVECLEQSIRFQTEARESQEAAAAAAVAAAEAVLVIEAEEATIVAEVDGPSGRPSAELEHLEVSTDDESSESCLTEVAVAV
ncbi:hypothetical protein KI688_011856 [Linnemannia hyalina]|uniref:SEC7 domain-containing protein n=1 Tax=Linnemannia hyalina TaxID=64524 RepID=A0A9P8BUM1_9FUNG|nr:hypothetical protein KI688_011856 [Linnemannia hyalina]